ncbi:MAG: chorismate synthase [Rickettsiales bacterium]|nr:chorismate synthase [Rickettsiales bacterium]
MPNTFGHNFRITTFGESHGGGVGVIIDGCPPGIEISESDIQQELDRRRPGQSEIVTPRDESDECEILSGTFDGKTIGTPICVLVRNKDARPQAYSEMAEKFRPSHADFTYQSKYGIRNWQGGGRSSARETIGRVASAAIAFKVIKDQFSQSFEVIAHVSVVQNIQADVDLKNLRREDVESNIVRCGDQETAEEMISLIKEARSEGNSLGGIVECVLKGVPIGLGDPVFDKLEADLAKGMMSLPATKGFEIGSGFKGVQMTGKDHNDSFYMDGDRVRTKTNRSGGVQGGISNGEDIVFRVAFKPTATIMTEQQTVSSSGEDTQLKGRGRHDPCVLPRAVPMVESMATLVICDHAMRHKAQCYK